MFEILSSTKENATKILKALIESGDIGHATPKSGLFDGVEYRTPARLTALIAEFDPFLDATESLSRKEFNAFLKEIAKVYPQMMAELSVSTKDRAAKDKHDARVKVIQERSEGLTPSQLDRIPFFDTHTSDIYLINSNFEILQDDYASHKSYLYSKFGSIKSEDPPTPLHVFNSRCEQGIIVFDPATTKHVWKDGDSYVLNVCPVPPWKRLENVTPRLPAEIQQFIEGHFFTDKTQIDRIYKTLSCLVYGRLQFAIGLIGSTGSGKDHFFSIMQGIVGIESTIKLERGHLTGTFNDALSRKRLLVADDEPMGLKGRDYVKVITNETMTINRKHKASNKMEKVHHSLLFTNNDYTTVYLANEDRRFSIPDITDSKLEKIWTIKQINTNRKLLEDPEHMAAFCGWLEEQHPVTDEDRFAVIKGKMYEKIVQASLTDWFRYILEYFDEAEMDFEMDFKDLRAKTNSYIKSQKREMVARLKNVDQLKHKVREYQKSEDENPVLDIYETDSGWMVRKVGGSPKISGSADDKLRNDLLKGF